MAERLNTIVDRVLSGLLGDAEHAEKQRPPLMLDMLSDWLPATTGEVVHADGGRHAVE
jgi:conjugal transfer ATP-binding protein TraC